VSTTLPVAVALREMRVADLDRVMQNEVRAYAFPWTRGIFLDCLRAGYENWVVELDGDIVGHGVLSVAAGEGHVLNVCIGRDHQGRGLGRRLTCHLIERARARAAALLFLEVRPSNHAAVRLYASLGFNEIGVRRNYYPAHDGHEDARVLALDLAAATS
jgi:ribosomal-protein-alanine N-acetyltransferase